MAVQTTISSPDKFTINDKKDEAPEQQRTFAEAIRTIPAGILRRCLATFASVALVSPVKLYQRHAGPPPSREVILVPLLLAARRAKFNGA